MWLNDEYIKSLVNANLMYDFRVDQIIMKVKVPISKKYFAHQ